MIDSKIEWCDDTVNVVEGCTEVDGDCKLCYAKGIAARFSLPHQHRDENGVPMGKARDGYYHGIARYSEKRHLPQWTGVVRMFPDRLDAMFWRLLRARSPRRQFLCSMGDLFHAEVPDAFLDEVFARIAILESRRVALADDFSIGEPHPILMLTKRPERAAVYTNAPDVVERVERAARSFIQRARSDLQHGDHPRGFLGEVTPPAYLRKGVPMLIGFSMPAWPLRSVALITSAGTQAGADARVPHLLRCKAAIRGVSCEPMTGPVDFSRWIAPVSRCKACESEHDGHVPGACPSCGRDALITVWGDEQLDRLRSGARYENGGPHEEDDGPQLDWMIVGGESGDEDAAAEDQRPRPCELAWISNVLEQCKAAGIPAFCKQLGTDLARRLERPGKGGKLEDLPQHLRIRQFPRIAPP